MMKEQEEYEGSENNSAAGGRGDAEQSMKSENPESTTSQTGDSQNNTSVSEEIGKQASKEVFRLRVIVIMILIMTAVAVSLTILFITREGEQEDFDTQFDGAAEKVCIPLDVQLCPNPRVFSHFVTLFSLPQVVDAFQDIVFKMGAVTALGVAFSAHGTFLFDSNFLNHDTFL